MNDWYETCKTEVMTGSALTFDKDELGRVITVTSYLSLVQLFGFLKYRSKSRVLLRGQTASFATHLQPSAFRGGKPWNLVSTELEDLLNVIRERCSIDTDADHRPSTEPLLQHYGLRTRWLDVVDSIPHALFFALNNPVYGDTSAYPEQSHKREWGYVYIIDCRNDSALTSVKVPKNGGEEECMGIWRAEDGFMLCDLRRAKPSKALRPHAQHGWLCRVPDGRTDLDDHIMVRVRIPHKAASTWVGGDSFSWNAMFPGSELDRNYKRLLEKETNKTINDWRTSTSRTLDPGRIITYLPAKP